ncbi:hypothetical protein NDU88_000351 [Pleurodeles waltl]|uniref:Uncharacterized protein n=1 Tax=Pleurodeles waltl TaxID=8319 RepID=A0AAV7KLZ4_PLEWA|nr:hypothetical protein NDU88_000351 [Pleurodeles waltl]
MWSPAPVKGDGAAMSIQDPLRPGGKGLCPAAKFDEVGASDGWPGRGVTSAPRGSHGPCFPFSSTFCSPSASVATRKEAVDGVPLSGEFCLPEIRRIAGSVRELAYWEIGSKGNEAYRGKDQNENWAY